MKIVDEVWTARGDGVDVPVDDLVDKDPCSRKVALP
jgi:hypothetical protein